MSSSDQKKEIKLANKGVEKSGSSNLARTIFEKNKILVALLLFYIPSMYAVGFSQDVCNGESGQASISTDNYVVWVFQIAMGYMLYRHFFNTSYGKTVKPNDLIRVMVLVLEAVVLILYAITTFFADGLLRLELLFLPVLIALLMIGKNANTGGAEEQDNKARYVVGQNDIEDADTILLVIELTLMPLFFFAIQYISLSREWSIQIQTLKQMVGNLLMPVFPIIAECVYLYFLLCY